RHAPAFAIAPAYAELGAWLTLIGCFAVPFDCLLFIHRHALTFFVTHTQLVLGQGVILRSGLPPQPGRLSKVNCNPNSGGIAVSQLVLGIRAPLCGALAVPLHRFHLILLHTSTLGIADTQVALSFGVILVCGFAPPFDSHFLILRHAFAFSVTRPKIDL